MRQNKLTVTPDGNVFLNETPIDRCLNISIKNINSRGEMEVELLIHVQEVDVRFPTIRLKKE